MTKRFLFVISLLIITVVAYIFVKPPTNPLFVVVNNNTSTNESPVSPYFASEFIPQPEYLKFSHSSTLIKLANGDLLALWFAGSKEGQPDVKIWQSRFTNGKWEMAHAVMSNYSLMYDSNRYISKLGNPVVYRASNGDLHLFVVSVSIGGWGGSRLNQLTSHDNGKTWSRALELVLNPFLNISTLDRVNAVSLQDGGFYLPVYHEFMRSYPFLLRFDVNGNFIEQIRISNKNTLLQPSLVAINESTAYVYMRNNNKKDNILYRQETIDGGLHWGNAQATNMTNPDSSLVVAKIAENKLLMVYNIAAPTGNRGKLALATSDDGINWRPVALLENSPNDEFSYPAIVVDGDQIDITYTWSRKSEKHVIKHIRFNLEWLNMS